MQINRDITDSQWAVLDPLIPEPSRRKDGRGRPWRARRPVLDGILWVLRTGAPWADLPDTSPPYQNLPQKISAMGAVGNSEGHIRGTSSGFANAGSPRCERGIHRRQFRPGEKRGSKVGKTKRGKGTKI